MLELCMLPAREGDALWIRWGAKGPTHQMLVDMGTEATGRKLRQRLEELPEAERGFELLVVTHVDRDHIGGVLTCLAEAEPLAGLEFADVWFNGWAHLSGRRVENADTEARPSELETWGPAQGERLTSWLAGQRWNGAFDGGPICRQPDRPLIPRTLAGGLRLTVLGPLPKRLSAFKPTWKREVQKALKKGRLDEVATGLERYGRDTPPRLDSVRDLERLAAQERHKKDSSKANGSSLALLLEYDGKRLLLAGDAYPWDLVDALAALGEEGPVELDAVKLSHHGSAKNLSEEFVAAVRTPRWLFSTDGNRFQHPDAIAVARVLKASAAPRTLCFNVPSKYNDAWSSGTWRRRFDYATRYGTAEDGLAISWDPPVGTEISTEPTQGRNAMATPESPAWTHHYAAVYQISEAEGPPKKKKQKKTRRPVELLVADGTEIGRPGSDLRRVLDTLQDQLLRKSIHPHAVNPTSRLLTFRADADGRPNASRDQLDRLLAAEGKDERRERALALAKQYLTVRNVRAGVLIFLVSEPPGSGLPGSGLPGEVGRCAFVFKCDFEAISQVDRRHLFHPIDHAIVETTKKAALYPYYSDGELDPETVRVFDEQGETGYWLNFLELGERTPAGRSHGQATVDRLAARLPEEVVEKLEAPPPVRPLDARRRSVDEEHRLTPEEAEEVIDEVTRETSDAKVTLRLDELRLEAPVAQYHHTWVIAEEGDERYIVLKGDTLEVRSRGVTAIEAVNFESFKEAVRRLGIRD